MLQNYSGQIKYHVPQNPLLKFVEEIEISFPLKISQEPLDKAMMVFTDGSSNGTSAVHLPGQLQI